MSEWQDIKTAPKEGKNRYKDPAPKIDILAKMWMGPSGEDRFEFRRFADCHWSGGDSMTNRKGGWKGVEDGYLAVAWMLIPEIPKEWPPKVERAPLTFIHCLLGPGNCVNSLVCAQTKCCMPSPLAGAYAPDAVDGNQPADEDIQF